MKTKQTTQISVLKTYLIDALADTIKRINNIYEEESTAKIDLELIATRLKVIAESLKEEVQK